MYKFFLVVLATYIEILIKSHFVDADAMMLSPVHRSSRWRYDPFSAPENTKDYKLNCGGSIAYWQLNNGQCGLCGDNFADDIPRANELGGIYGDGDIVKTYTTGDAPKIGIQVYKNYRGYFEFELCNMDDLEGETEGCFRKNKLRIIDGSDRYYIGEKRGFIGVSVQLPVTLACDHCVLRWSYYTEKSQNCDVESVDCAPPGPFKNCADISIV